ncbi:protein phosphatase 2C 51-like isoform X2 [Salvia hispanica]|uniref:protein phosphatase 2C 51-like isoform X2 n=1 Tax=Salvia hispanica TaxID=49212 RepID=UPI0020091CA6|nr:protein phosphatase 2C 51-like isoform X2 [Salvia hispanica]
MIESVKASHSQSHNTTETRKGCRKREQSPGEGPSERPLNYGLVSILGRMRVMRDPIMVMPPRSLPGGYSFFAAYGCGAGAVVAETCSDKLHHCLERHAAAVAEERIGWGQVVMDCFSSIYEEHTGSKRMLKFTAVVAAPHKGEVVVVNSGGSRAVLWSGGVALPLWNDPNKGDESVKTEEGAIVYLENLSGEEECVKASRSSEPEVRVIRRNDDGDNFLIIACGGLWEVVGKEMACEVVRKCLRRSPLEGGGDISQATAMLAELAIAKGSKDSIAIVVLQLNST